MRAIYKQEHFLPIIRTNVVHFADNKGALVQLVKGSLEQPDQYNKNAAACVQEIITYNDGKSANRAVAAIKKFFA